MFKLYWKNRILLFVSCTLLVFGMLLGVGQTRAAYLNETSFHSVYPGGNLLPDSNCLSEAGNTVLMKDWCLATDAGKIPQLEILLERPDGLPSGTFLWSSGQAEYLAVEVSEVKDEAEAPVLATEKTYLLKFTPNQAKLQENGAPVAVTVHVEWIPDAAELQSQKLSADIKFSLKLAPEDAAQPETPTEPTEPSVPEEVPTAPDTVVPETPTEPTEPTEPGTTTPTTPGETTTPDTNTTPQPETPATEESETPTTASLTKRLMLLLGTEVTGEGTQPTEPAPITEPAPVTETTTPTEPAAPPAILNLNGIQTDLSRRSPILLSLTALEETEVVTLTLSGCLKEDGTTAWGNFPAFTKYSTDGAHYTVLADGGAIAFAPAEIQGKLLRIDFSYAEMSWKAAETGISLDANALQAGNLLANAGTGLTLGAEEQELFPITSNASAGSSYMLSEKQILQFTVKEYLKYQKTGDITLNYWVEQLTPTGYIKVPDTAPDNEKAPLLETGAYDDTTEDLTLILSTRRAEQIITSETTGEEVSTSVVTTQAGTYRLVLQQVYEGEEIKRTEIPFFVRYDLSNEV